MNSNHKNGEFGSPLDDDLDTISQTYRGLGQEEPPALLDQAILNSAHRAVEKQSHWLQFGWLHGLTTAAVIVLAFTIILQQGDPVPGPAEIAPLDSAMLPEEENTAGKAPSEAAQRFRMDKKLDIRKQDKDIPLGELIPQQEMADMAVPAAASVQAATDQVATDQAELDRAASLMVEPEKSQMLGMAREQADPEKELEAILNLKREGDDSWKEALDQFIQRYPDFALPEGLED